MTYKPCGGGGGTGREEYEGAIAGSIPVISQYGIGTGLDWLRGATPRSLQCAFFSFSPVNAGKGINGREQVPGGLSWSYLLQS